MENQKILTEELIRASVAYYNGQDSGMSDLEFDRKVEELRKMEAESGIVLAGSPTVNVGAVAVTALKQVRHEYPALSLDKVKYKDKEELVKWLSDIGDEDFGCAVMSWKCDGLTVVLTYDNGTLTRAVTRGNGEVGSDVTHNAIFFKGVPNKIPFKGHLVVRGEALMTFEEFKKVNAENDGMYENPRNLASATIQMLDADESRKREIQFKAFELVCPEPERDTTLKINETDNHDDCYTARFMDERFRFLEQLGFDVVDNIEVNKDTVLTEIEEWKEKLKTLDYPTDGLVFSYNDVSEGWALGSTGHHPRWAVAMKWTDETVTTTIRDIEWSVGKTGIITPVAVFDQVRLGLGSNVTRASLHNLSIMGKLGVMIGSKAEVYLANMIIPQIASCTGGDKEISYPLTCPVCGGETYVDASKDVAVLKCTNSNCAAQQVGKLMNTFSKDGLFIKGLGESQILDLIDIGLITDANDVYTLKARAAEDADTQHAVAHLLGRDGWGKKKWGNLLNAIDASRETTLQKFLYSLNVPLLGNDLSKKLSKFWHGDVNHFRVWIDSVRDEGREKALLELMTLDGIGNEKAENLVRWAEETTAYREKYEDLLALINELEFPEPKAESSDNSLEGLTFVITGAVHDYKNRDEFKASVEARGGKVAGSISAKTSFLVANDKDSGTGKAAKAATLGIPTLTEDEFIEKFGR